MGWKYSLESFTPVNGWRVIYEGNSLVKMIRVHLRTKSYYKASRLTIDH